MEKNMSLTELLFLIVTIALITFLFRYTPFLLPKNIIQNDFVINFGKKLPSGIMLILFLYSTGLSEEYLNFKQVNASFLAAIPVILIYIWKKNAVVSIFAGVTFFYLFTNHINF
jgi:branched-subunit amino acid transport protein AzlD